MKVLNLQCGLQHSFEGWFGSEDDFQSQLARGMIECPLCTDKHIQKMPSAPRLNLGSYPGQKNSLSAPGIADSPAQANDAVATRTAVQEMAGSSTEPVHTQGAGGGDRQMLANLTTSEQAAFLQALRQVVSKTEDVGLHFAEEARRMHYGEVQARGIRGQASMREAVELLEEGIEVMPLAMLPALKETLQ